MPSAASSSLATLDAAAETYLKRVVLDRGVLGLMSERLRDKDTTPTDLAATEAALAQVKKRQSVVAGAVASLDDPAAAAPLLEKLAMLARERRGLEADRDGCRVATTRRAPPWPALTPSRSARPRWPRTGTCCPTRRRATCSPRSISA